MRTLSVRWLGAIVVLLLTSGRAADAQNLPKGYVSLFADYFPSQGDTTELRSRVFVEETLEPSPRFVVRLSGFAEGLWARRPDPSEDGSLSQEGSHSKVTGGIARVHDANVTFSRERFDVLAGYARAAWGKLDEIQPTDVINPLDVSRFFFEGRSEARLSTFLLRGRLHLGEDVTVEGIYVPDFRRGRFDQLEEPSSPFNLPVTVAADPVVCLAIGCPVPPVTVIDRQPRFAIENGQGGGRVSVTTRRIDWSVAAFRGFESFGLYRLEPPAAPPPVPPSSLALVYPRFTMIGGDFEAVRGQWGLRGEVAAFVEDHFQSTELRVVSGTSFDAGVGVDRRAGDYTVSGTVLVHSESYDAPLTTAQSDEGRRDVSFIASADRTFARETYRLRGFGVYNVSEGSGFIRGIGVAGLRDNLALEASLGWFLGRGRDLIGRFEDSDFAYARLKYYF
jgi:hypothetical protein